MLWLEQCGKLKCSSHEERHRLGCLGRQSDAERDNVRKLEFQKPTKGEFNIRSRHQRGLKKPQNHSRGDPDKTDMWAFRPTDRFQRTLEQKLALWEDWLWYRDRDSTSVSNNYHSGLCSESSLHRDCVIMLKPPKDRKRLKSVFLKNHRLDNRQLEKIHQLYPRISM